MIIPDIRKTTDWMEVLVGQLVMDLLLLLVVSIYKKWYCLKDCFG